MALLARWRADQLTFEDTGGTDACENGDGVAAWGIYEGSQAGSLATQSTSGNRPIWNADDGGYPSVSVTGSSVQRLNLAHSASWVITAFSWLAVIRLAEIQLNHIWGRGSSWANAGCHLSYVGASAIAKEICFHTQYNARSSSSVKPDNTSATWFVIAGIADAECIKCYVNRQSMTRMLQSQTINFGTNPLTLFGDGSTNAAYHMTGAAREFAFWDAALTESEIAAEITASMSRWGVSNTVTPPSSGGVSGFTGLSGVGRLGT